MPVLRVLSHRFRANERVMLLQSMTGYKIASTDVLNEYVLLVATEIVMGMPALPVCAARQIHPKALENMQQIPRPQIFPFLCATQSDGPRAERTPM